MPPGVRPGFYPYLLLVSVTMLVFGNVLANEFVWDDKIFIIGKPIYRQFDLFNILFHPYQPANGVEYLPVRDLSYFLDYYVWGQSDFGFHLTNLLLYSLSVILVFHLSASLRDVFDVHSSERGEGRRHLLLPICTALLFAVHPLHSQVVAFVIQRNTLLSGVFFFTVLLLYLRYLQAVAGAIRYVCWLSSFVCCMLAFFSKGTSVMLPLIMALVLACSNYRREMKEWAALTPFIAASIFTAWLFSDVASHTGFMNANPIDFGAFSFSVKLVRALQIPWFYLSKLIMPTGLAPEYISRFSSVIMQPLAILSVVALTAVAALAWRMRHSHQLVLISIGWYFIALLPVLNLFPTYPVVADRYAYLPSFGFCLLVAHVLVEVMKNRPLPVLVVTLGLLLFWSELSIRENRIWHDDRKLYETMVIREPKLARGSARLGYVCLQEGKWEEALRLFRKAAEIDPSMPDVECQMGSRALKMGNYHEAIEWFDKALLRRETHIVSLFLCGVAYMKANDLLNASSYFSRVISSPDADINNLKPQARFGLEQLVKPFAEKQARDIILQNSQPGQLHQTLARFYQRYHLYDEAFKQLEALPQPAGYDENLMRAGMYADQGRFDQALLHYERCLIDRAEAPQALYGAGQVQQRRKKFVDALAYYDRALRASPAWAAPIFQQSVIYFLTGNKNRARIGFMKLRQDPLLKWRVAAYERKLDEL